ncbi:hypothetical protein HMPREF0662_02208 [Prevotella nigrescens F0103]|nr:hypothetical protein HMPREF0662_02208 [Prevotella nigrescens F0103]
MVFISQEPSQVYPLNSPDKFYTFYYYQYK